MALSPRTKAFFLRDALAPYTEDLRVLDTGNPASFEMNGAGYSVHISAVHAAGAGRGNRDEQRVQVRRAVIDLQRQRQDEGINARFIGFFPDGQVFTAWEPEYVFSQNPESGGSVYARRSHRRIALERGSALRPVAAINLGRETRTLSFPSEQLGFYLENCEALHAANRPRQLRRALRRMAEAVERGRTRATTMLGGQRRRVTITRHAYPRSPEFTRLVVEAYGHACCICRKQLGLVEAAHIIPHSHDDATDEVSNGLALCAEHHKLYDSGLVTILAGGRIGIDRNRVEHLQNIGQDRGLNAVERLDGRQIRMPADANDRPDDQLLDRGARIRMGTGA